MLRKGTKVQLVYPRHISGEIVAVLKRKDMKTLYKVKWKMKQTWEYGDGLLDWSEVGGKINGR
jgi:hypothetical protein